MEDIHMLKPILLYVGAALPFFWGIAHLFPTKSIVKGFGRINADNRHILTMEWIVEGVFLIFIGVLVASVTFLDAGSMISLIVYLLSVIVLMVMALISLFTGFQASFIAFKLCPFIFALSAVLIFIGRLL
jgi:hypothetical protein